MHSFSTLSALLLVLASTSEAFTFGPSPAGWNGKSTFNVKGNTGVGAMQAAVTTNNKIIFLDRVENNPLKHGGTPYWGSEMDLKSTAVRGLSMVTNSFCAGGSWLKDGTLASLGGDPYTGYGAKNGLQAVRLFKPCDNGKCQIQENPSKVHMHAPRWYPSTTRISDGSVLIMGGVSETTHMTPEMTLEYYPSKGNAVKSPFLRDTSSNNWNLFPHGILLPDGRVFVAANNQAMIFNPKNNQEQRLPNFPDSVRVCYPLGAGSALLPLSSKNGWNAEVLFCGGTSLKQGQYPGKDTNAISKCYRMLLTPAGIARGWQQEAAPDGRIMGNLVITPGGQIVYINGAGSGTAGYFNTKQKDGSYSSAAKPRKTPYLYDPEQPAGKRWSQLGVRATQNRVYHSVATLVPDGRILTAGSNPNPNFDTSKGNPYPTNLKVEWLNPPYLKQARPSYSGLPGKIGYGGKFSLKLNIPSGASTNNIKVSIHDLGFSTHGIDYNTRAVFLDFSLSGSTLSVNGPPSSGIYPPGPAWLYVTVSGVPSPGQKVMVG